MKRVVFIVSHIGARSEVLTYLLNLNERVDIQTTYDTYLHPTDLEKLYVKPHKCRSSAAIYGDQILHNVNFQCKRLHDMCDFIYLIRNGKESLPEMFISNANAQFTYRYYCFRIRRIYEMAKRTPKAFLLTYQDMKKGDVFDLLSSFLKLKKPISKPPMELLNAKPVREIPSKLLDKSQDCFEYYLYKLKNIPHLWQIK